MNYQLSLSYQVFCSLEFLAESGMSLAKTVWHTNNKQTLHLFQNTLGIVSK